jgi:hypothetical protein
MHAKSCSPERISLGTDEIVEFGLLLPGWQASALEATAHRRGQTAAQMIRQLIAECLGERLAFSFPVLTDKSRR